METRISPDRLAQLVERAATTRHVVMVLNTPNKNGRIYPTDVMVNALANMRFPIFGCFMHDLSQGYIDLAKISHKVLNMWIDGNNVFADIVVLPKMPMGKVLSQLPNSEYRTAGTCYIDMNGVVSNYSLISVGAVANGQGA